MATQAPPQNTSTAVQAWEGPREITAIMEGHPAALFNLLVPTMSVRQVNPYLVPDIEYVKLSTNEADGDIYHDPQMKQGMYAPTAKGLSKLRQVAGIDVLDSRRTDSGKDPDVVEWTVMVEMALPSGQRVRGPGSKRIDLHQLGQGQTPQWLKKAREHLVANAETKALNRAIRSLLSLHGAMPAARFNLPFAVLRWVPNMSDPDVRKRMLENLLPATTATYGPDPRQVGPGEDVVVAAEVVDDPDDDEANAAAYVEKYTGDDGIGTVSTATGEIVAERAADTPDWFADVSMVDRLRKAAPAEAQKGTRTEEQRVKLSALFSGRILPEKVGPLLARAYGVTEAGSITIGQANGILDVANTMGVDAFAVAWIREADALS